MLLVTLITAQPMLTCQKPTMPPCQKKPKRFLEVQINSMTPQHPAQQTHYSPCICFLLLDKRVVMITIN